MKYLVYLNPLLLFLISLLFFSSSNYSHFNAGIFATMLLQVGVFFACVTLFVFARLRRCADTYKVMTYTAILWLLYPLFIVMPLNAVLGAVNLKDALPLDLIGTVLFCGGVILIIKFHHKMAFTESFQIIYFVFAVIVLSFQMPNIYSFLKDGKDTGIKFTAVEEALVGVEPQITPHIIYIVPDRYASNRSLKAYYDFDNTAFTEDLRARGFYVWDNQKANYTKTFQSLASTLNMDYLDGVAETVGAKVANYSPVYRLLEDNQVQRILRRDGYDFINMGNWWEPTRLNPYADENISRPGFLDEYMMRYLQLTPLASFFRYGLQDSCALVERQKDYVLDAVQKDKPQFVFWHLFTIHDPYLYDEEGNCRTGSSLVHSWEDRKEVYINHVRLTNKMLLGLYDELMTKTQRPVVFVIQSDEGPYPREYRQKEENYHFWEASPEDIDLKYGIFHAVYMPSSLLSSLSPNDLAVQTTPVNNFRSILSMMYGQNLPLLPDKSFTFDTETYPYDLKEISDRLVK